MTRRRWISASALAGFSVICSLAVTQSATAGMKTYYSESRGKVRIVWSGRIQRPMAKQLSRAISKWHDRALNGVELVLNSGGGSMREGHNVIKTLRRLRKTRRLTTAVLPGTVCGSACIPIFLQGETRVASAATLWLLHEVSKSDPKTKKLIALRPKKTQQFFRRYFLPAGVPQGWIDMITPKIRGKDVWWTGGQIYSSGSNIITRRIKSSRKRRVQPRST